MTVSQIKDHAGAVVDDVMTSAHERVPFFSHTLATIKHFGRHRGSVLAGGVTYFGFLSFFPILALTFSVVGLLSRYYSGVEDWVQQALDSALPGLVGNNSGQIRIRSIANAGATAGVIGAVGLLYSGLGYLSAMATALQAMFELPDRDKRNLVVAKLFDLVTLVVVGVTLVLSVAVTGFVTGFSQDIVDWLGLPSNAGVKAALWLLSILLGVAASTVLFLTIFVLLGKPNLPRRALVGGATLAAIGFEVLKIAAAFLIAHASKSPAAAVVGVSLVLLVWINYFARLTLYGAAWAATGARTGPASLDEAGATRVEPAVAVAASSDSSDSSDRDRPTPVGRRRTFATGALVGAVIGGVVARGFSRRDEPD